MTRRVMNRTTMMSAHTTTFIVISIAACIRHFLPQSFLKIHRLISSSTILFPRMPTSESVFSKLYKKVFFFYPFMLVLVLPFRRADPDKHHDSPQITAAVPHSIFKRRSRRIFVVQKSRSSGRFVFKKLEAMENIIFAIMTLSTLQKK